MELLTYYERQHGGARAVHALCALAMIGISLGVLLGVLAPTACATRERALMGWTFKVSGWRVGGVAHHPRVGRYRARSAVVGGSQISIERAPWQVALLGAIPVEIEGEKGFLTELCGGAIISETRVLTAAHCVFDPETGTQAPAEDFFVVAGSSNLDQAEPTEQDVAVAGIHVHPYFNYNGGPGTSDDVAILRLNRSLNLAGMSVRAIGVAPADSMFSTGSRAEFSGFGEESVGSEPNGKLYSLGVSLQTSQDCGGEADALFLCASSQAGSACAGDSGGGLTSNGATPTLLGILSTVEIVSNERCHEGADAGFTNLAAPEIRDFIENETSPPPKAPRGGAGVNLSFSDGPKLFTGETMTCSPGSWSGLPAFTYNFLNSTDGQVLQSGYSSTYLPTTADVGDKILCELQAANAGGTAVERTDAVGPVEALPAWVVKAREREYKEATEEAERNREKWEAVNRVVLPAVPKNEEPCGEESVVVCSEVMLGSARITVQSGGMALVKLACTGSEACSGKLAVSVRTTSRKGAKKKRSRTVTIGTAKFSIAAGKTTIVKVKLDAAGRGLLEVDRGRLTASLEILEPMPGPTYNETANVHLAQQTYRGKAKK
jgi:Trypsin